MDTFSVEVTLRGIEGLVAPLTGGDPAASTGTTLVTRRGTATCTEPAEDPAPPPPVPADRPSNESGQGTGDGGGDDNAAGAGLECEVGVTRFAGT